MTLSTSRSATARGELLKKAGFEIVLDQQYAQKSSDFSSLLALVKSKAPDVVLWGGLAAEVLDQIRQAKSLDVNPKGFTSSRSACRLRIFARRLDKDAEYASA